MSDGHSTSRRGFLTNTAKVAAAAGLVGATADAKPKPFDRGPKIVTKAGPTPREIGADATINVGMIGIGGRGRGLIDRLVGHDKISFKALADPSEKNAKWVIDKVGKATGEKIDVYHGEEDYKTKLLTRDDIDVVISATPCYLHGPVYLACFQAGKHFYGEKPMCIHANEADALVEAFKKNPKVKGQIGFQRRATEQYEEGIKRIRDGLIGDPVDGRAAWNNNWGPIGLPKEGPRVWLGRREYSGDWMLEQACHTFDVLNWVAGEEMPIAASGIGRRDLFKDIDPKRDVTDYYIAHLQYNNGFSVDYEHSWICPHNDEYRFTGVFEYIAGLKGGIALNVGTYYQRGGEKKKEEYYRHGGDHTGLAIQSFINSVRNDKPVCSNVITGRNATYAALLVRKAVDERRWVEMKELM